MNNASSVQFPQAVLYRAAMLGEISILGVDQPHARVRPADLLSLRSPAVAVIAANSGPGTVTAARMLRSWARVAIVHAVIERPQEYEVVSVAVQAYRRVLLVETVPSLARSWAAFLRERLPVSGWLAGGVIL